MVLRNHYLTIHTKPVRQCNNLYLRISDTCFGGLNRTRRDLDIPPKFLKLFKVSLMSSTEQVCEGCYVLCDIYSVFYLRKISFVYIFVKELHIVNLITIHFQTWM
jgi:hypothetical protein